MAHSLPADIICLVIDEFKDCRASLKTFALVNRFEWLSYSRYLLFRSITLLDHRVDGFLSLCRSPCSTLGEAIRSFTVSQRRISSWYSDDSGTVPRSSAKAAADSDSLSVNKLFTWKSPYDTASTILRNLQSLSIGGVEWGNITALAKKALYCGFLGVTNLELFHVDFWSGDELFLLLSSFPLLQSLLLDHVVQRNNSAFPVSNSEAKLEAEQLAARNRLGLSVPSIRIMKLRNMRSGSPEIINALIPFASGVTTLNVHFLDLSSEPSEFHASLGNLITVTGGSLKELSITSPSKSATCLFDHWDVAANIGLTKLHLDVDVELEHFLRAMTTYSTCNGVSKGPSRLEILDAPRLIKHCSDLKRIDEIFQHHYFSSLVKLKSVVRVQQPMDWQLIFYMAGLSPTVASREKMDEAVKVCQEKLDGCNKRGILELQRMYE